MSSLVSSLDNIVHLHLTPIRDNLPCSLQNILHPQTRWARLSSLTLFFSSTPLPYEIISLVLLKSFPPPHLQTRWAHLSRHLTILSTSTSPPYETISLSRLKRESHCLSRDSFGEKGQCCSFMREEAQYPVSMAEGSYWLQGTQDLHRS